MNFPNPQSIQETFRSRRWVFHVTSGEAHARTCQEELCNRLPHIEPSSWEERSELGGIYLNGRRVALSEVLSSPFRLEYFEPVVPLERVASLYPRWDPRMVLWRDDDVGVVWKPAGLPTTAPRDQTRYSLERYVCDHLSTKVHFPSRLDTGVCGVLLISLSPRMNRYLQKAYERRRVWKCYLAEVNGSFPHTELSITDSLARDPHHPVLRRVVPVGGESAHTEVIRVASFDRQGHSFSLLQAQPITGRTHQIRVHLAGSGFPIVGDPYYGGCSAPELRLVSFAVAFHHPFAQKEVVVELPLDARPDWLRAYENIGVFRDGRRVDVKT